ncbi:unnamed protein product, partial [Vitis vinifera]|uniref:Uncharacterized protein n=1 Tax=Vitis vinifera TaxID=29760 RepID=E0CPM1_VITVI
MKPCFIHFFSCILQTFSVWSPRKMQMK